MMCIYTYSLVKRVCAGHALYILSAVCIQTACILRVLIVHLSVERVFSALNILKIPRRAFGGQSLTKTSVYVEPVLNLIIKPVLNLIIKNNLNRESSSTSVSAYTGINIYNGSRYFEWRKRQIASLFSSFSSFRFRTLVAWVFGQTAMFPRRASVHLSIEFEGRRGSPRELCSSNKNRSSKIIGYEPCILEVPLSTSEIEYMDASEVDKEIPYLCAIIHHVGYAQTEPCWCYEPHSSSDPPHGCRHTYQDSSCPCSYSTPWRYVGSYSFLHSSSLLVLLCLILPSGVNPGKYGGEWLIPPYIGMNLYIGSRYFCMTKKKKCVFISS
jgi:hypothetical protein